MYTFDGEECEDSDSLTLTTENYSDYPIPNYAKAGNGYVRITALVPNLQYSEKNVSVDVGDTYRLNGTLSYEYPDSSIPNVSVGGLRYVSSDSSIATVSSNGTITGISEGIARIQIIDTTNGYSTFVFVEVKNGIKPDIQIGSLFSVVLKQDGTVWSYGENCEGELGLGDNVEHIEPMQVTRIPKTKAISTGYDHTVALTEDGEVYAWGYNEHGQLGNGTNDNANIPVKVNGLNNIKKIDAHRHMTIALDEDGNVYIWGEDFDSIPTKVTTQEPIIDISGYLLLSESGHVYEVWDTENYFNGLENIAKISCGEDHNLALDVNATAFAWGGNDYGQCGLEVGEYIYLTELAENIYDISAGSYTRLTI